MFGLSCCCWATGITAASRSSRPRCSSSLEFNCCTFYFCTVNWKWNGEAVLLGAPSCREHSARYKMYLGQRLAETLGVLAEAVGGAGHSDGRGSPGRKVRAKALCPGEVKRGVIVKKSSQDPYYYYHSQAMLPVVFGI